MPFTDSQQLLLALMPKITGLLSLCGSVLVVYSVLQSSVKRARIYHRLILGISICDISNSIFFGLSTWPIPSSSFLKWAVGNQLTCTIQGFFIQMGIAASIFNGCLSVYYVLILKYDWCERQIGKYQPLLYGIPILWGCGTAIMGLALNLYNNANLWCWIASLPAGCDLSDNCIRGANATNYRWAFYYGPLWSMILLVTVSQISVLLHIRKVLPGNFTTATSSKKKKKKRHAGDSVSLSNEILAQSEEELSGAFTTLDDDDNNDNDNNDNKPANKTTKTTTTKQQKKKQVEKFHEKRKREITTQCFLYAGSFYLNWCALTAVRILQAAELSVEFPLIVFAATITPLQGLPNLLIYVYPNYLHEKRIHPDGTRWRWFMDAIHK